MKMKMKMQIKLYFIEKLRGSFLLRVLRQIGREIQNKQMNIEGIEIFNKATFYRKK
jgi:hypothetical protein